MKLDEHLDRFEMRDFFTDLSQNVKDERKFLGFVNCGILFLLSGSLKCYIHITHRPHTFILMIIVNLLHFIIIEDSLHWSCEISSTGYARNHAHCEQSRALPAIRPDANNSTRCQ